LNMTALAFAPASLSRDNRRRTRQSSVVIWDEEPRAE
jgi:hypothetical protein